MDTTEQPRLADAVLRTRLAPPYTGSESDSVPSIGQFVRFSAALLMFVGVLAIAGRSEHPLLAMPAGPFVTFVSLVVPASAAVVAAYALYRPWYALIAILALAPLWNSAYVSWQVGSVQVILQTVFVVTLAIGAVTNRPDRGTFLWSASDLSASARSKGFAALRLAEVAVAGLIGLAIISTLASHDVQLSATVLLHGIVEPIALAAILVYLRPTRRDIVAVVIALGVSIGLGTVFNIVQMLPSMTSMEAIQAQRLLFARASFGNVGLYAAVIAITLPLVVAAMASRRALSMPRWATALMVATLVAGAAGLFFSLSKSAWIATGGSTVLVLLLVVHSWRRRVAMILAAVVVSTMFIPWPAFFLQAVPTADAAYRSAMVTLIGESRFDSWNPATITGRGSLSERFYAADAGVRMALANPILGVGLDQFGPNYRKAAYRPPQATLWLDHAHSFFPEVGAELGVPAAALVFVIYAASMLAMWRVYRAARDRLTKMTAAGLFASLAAWLVVATAFGCYIYRPTSDAAPDVAVSAVVVGVAIALARTVQSERPWRPAR